MHRFIFEYFQNLNIIFADLEYTGIIISIKKFKFYIIDFKIIEFIYDFFFFFFFFFIKCMQSKTMALYLSKLAINSYPS